MKETQEKMEEMVENINNKLTKAIGKEKNNCVQDKQENNGAILEQEEKTEEKLNPRQKKWTIITDEMEIRHVTI